MNNNIFPYNRKANYYETDMMGVVHHSNYIRWFEEARIDLMEQAGFPYQAMEDIGVIIPVISVECQYKHFVTFDEEVTIIAKIAAFNGIRMDMTYEIYRNSDNTLCVTGKSSHCFLNKDKQILRLKRDYPDIYTFFNNLVSN
jgi:acyl-CoA thioester hydrolase